MKFAILKFLQNSSVAESLTESGADTTTTAAQVGIWETLSPLFLILVFGLVFYLFILRPEKKRKKEAEAQREAMRVGDTVITIGGITGEIESIRTETVTIFTGNNSIDIQKWAIRSIEPAEGDDR